VRCWPRNSAQNQKPSLFSEVGDVYFYFAHDVVVLATRILVRFLIQEAAAQMQSWQDHEHPVQEENLDISVPALLRWADALTDGVTWICAEQVGPHQELSMSPIEAHNQENIEVVTW
jgi:hypothetical protein